MKTVIALSMILSSFTSIAQAQTRPDLRHACTQDAIKQNIAFVFAGVPNQREYQNLRISNGSSGGKLYADKSNVLIVPFTVQERGNIGNGTMSDWRDTAGVAIYETEGACNVIHLGTSGL